MATAKNFHLVPGDALLTAILKKSMTKKPEK